MALLTVDSITKYYGQRVLLDGVTFSVERGERVALVGTNGSGKTTLLEIIMGAVESDGGHVSIESGSRIGYHRQEARVDSALTVLAEVLWSRPEVMECELRLRDLEAQMADATGQEALDLGGEYGDLLVQYDHLDGYAHEAEAKAALGGLGFKEADWEKPVTVLSGGEASRVALARLLVRKPDILCLDEPTNHLDIDALEWLEEFVLAFHGAVLVVSHDRYFLDRIATEIVDLERGSVSIWPGNYSEYTVHKAEARRQYEADYQRQRAEMKRLETFVSKWGAGTRSTQAKDRAKKLARIDPMAPPGHDGPKMKAKISAVGRTGHHTLSAQGISKAFGDRTLFRDLSLAVIRGERVGVVGPNGSWKTTLIDILRGESPPDTGEVTLGLRASVGYLPQEVEPEDSDREIILEMLDTRDFLLQEARDLLARFQFVGDDIYKKVGVLSGGELRRLWLAKLVATQPNLLILDEPTNHLDLAAREGLDDALRNYTGTLIFVSHDRYLLRGVATRLVEVDGGEAKVYEGGYEAYREAKMRLRTPPPPPKPVRKKTTLPKFKMRNKPGKPAAPKPRTAEDIEVEIGQVEARLAELTQTLADPDTYGADGRRVQLATAEYDGLTAQLAELYAEWESFVSE